MPNWGHHWYFDSHTARECATGSTAEDRVRDESYLDPEYSSIPSREHSAEAGWPALTTVPTYVHTLCRIHRSDQFPTDLASPVAGTSAMLEPWWWILHLQCHSHWDCILSEMDDGRWWWQPESDYLLWSVLEWTVAVSADTSLAVDHPPVDVTLPRLYPSSDRHPLSPLSLVG